MAEKIACEQCHRPATHKGTNSHGSNFLCGDCIASNEAAGDEIDAHEMKHFGGAYGLVERMHYEPLARNAGFIRADLVDDLVKACRMASDTGVHIGRGEYSISQEAMQALDAALTRIKGGDRWAFGLSFTATCVVRGQLRGCARFARVTRASIPAQCSQTQRTAVEWLLG